MSTPRVTFTQSVRSSTRRIRDVRARRTPDPQSLALAQSPPQPPTMTVDHLRITEAALNVKIDRLADIAERISLSQEKAQERMDARTAALEKRAEELALETQQLHQRLDQDSNRLQATLPEHAQSQLDSLARKVEAMALDPHRTCTYAGEIVGEELHKHVCGNTPLSFWAALVFWCHNPNDAAREAGMLTVEERACSERSAISDAQAKQDKLLSRALSKTVLKDILKNLNSLLTSITSLVRYIQRSMIPNLRTSGFYSADLKNFLTDQSAALLELKDFLNTTFSARYPAAKWSDPGGGQEVVRESLFVPLTETLCSLGSPFSNSYAAFRACCHFITITESLTRRSLTDVPVYNFSVFEDRAGALDKRLKALEDKNAKSVDTSALAKDVEQRVVNNVQKANNAHAARVNASLAKVNAPPAEATSIKGADSSATSSTQDKQQTRPRGRQQQKRRREDSREPAPVSSASNPKQADPLTNSKGNTDIGPSGEVDPG